MRTDDPPGMHGADAASATRPIEAVGTSVAAFVGFAASGPGTTLVSSWHEFSQIFGGSLPGSYLALAVHGFFLNGGRSCCIVRIAPDAPVGAGPALPPVSSGGSHVSGEIWTMAGAATAGVLKPEDVIGDARDGTGLSGLDAVADVAIVAVPDLMAGREQGSIDLGVVKAVHDALIAHCERMGNRVAIIDPPPGLDAQQVKDWRVDGAGYDSAYAALYWPWVESTDPTTGASSFVPPSGHVAGVWARSDDTRGVHAAPAGEEVRGVTRLERGATAADQEFLNPVGVNCIRTFPGRGVRVWGARTLSSQPEWKYVNVRRFCSYLEESIHRGTQWAVFEPNDPALPDRLRDAISAFLRKEWLTGALVGRTEDEAFFVRCDAATDPVDRSTAGRVACRVGVALVRPAEFLTLRLVLSSGGLRSR